MKCPKCGNENPQDRVKCWSCGNDLVEHTDVSLETENIECPACGKVSPTGSVFCVFCGNKLVFDEKDFEDENDDADPIICPSCGMENIHGARYCNKCGKKLQINEEEENNNGSNSDDSSPEILGELIGGAIALVLLGIALYNFKVYYDTLYTVNGISTSEAPRYLGIACVFLIIGLIVGMARGHRAKVFAPFAALDGFGGAIRTKDVDYVPPVELSEDDQRCLNERLNSLAKLTAAGKQMDRKQIKVTVEYYVPCDDPYHDAYFVKGTYVTITGICWKVDGVCQSILVGDTYISFDRIRRLDSEIFEDDWM